MSAMVAAHSPPPLKLPARTFSAADLADLFGVTRWTIFHWERTGALPRGRRIGPKSVRWTEDDIAPLLAKQGG